MNQITASEFIKSWKEFSIQFIRENPDWLKAYQHDGTWSPKFLGTKRSNSECSPIGKFIKDKFHLNYRTEDGSFDIAFSSAENFKKIPFILKNKIETFELEEQFYPAYYDILIEVENDCNTAWQEMTKLTWVRCPLKVLVTYNSSDENESIIALENEMLVQSFTTIIDQSNKTFADNVQTEYLMIVGNAKDENLNWNFFQFDSTGKLK